MAYRSDSDLEFLGKMKSPSLNELVKTLTEDNDGSQRLTEELTKTPRYKLFYPDHKKYWQSIAAEIQCFGANTFSTLLRGGKGVLYREILTDVCGKFKVNYNKNDSTSSIENHLLIKLLGDAVEKMDAAAQKEFAKMTGINAAKMMSPEGIAIAAQAIFRAGGFQSYQLALIVANTVSKALLGRGLALAGNAGLTRALGIVSGPIGWGLTGAWTLIDIASPAFRVTLPAVIHVALLRKQYQAEIDGLWDDIEKSINSTEATEESVDAMTKFIIECSNCAQKLRIPAKGNLEVTCPNCRNQWEVSLT